MNGDAILRSYSVLISLRKNIPENDEVEEYWVKEYNSAIEKIEISTSKDLSDFKVQSDCLQKAPTSFNTIKLKASFGVGSCCERSILIHKLDAVLTYFNGIDSGTDNSIGFIRP